MHPEEQDIIAALLKSVWEHGLIPEPTYHVALNKLFYTFDAPRAIGYDNTIKQKGVHSHGHKNSTR
jgi:hypothetical protein